MAGNEREIGADEGHRRCRHCSKLWQTLLGKKVGGKNLWIKSAVDFSLFHTSPIYIIK
jgi:hypothetical protein